MNRYEKQSTEIGKGSFAFAWVMDSGSSERSRGVKKTCSVYILFRVSSLTFYLASIDVEMCVRKM